MRVDTSAFLRCRRRPMTLVTRSPRASHRSRWCVTETTTIRFPRATVAKRFWRRDMSTGSRSPVAARQIATHVRSYDRFSHLRNAEIRACGPAVGAGMRIGVRRDNQGENPATMRMRMRRCWDDEGRAEFDWSRRQPSELRPFGRLAGSSNASPLLPHPKGEERFCPWRR
jgi:hypothetical protein